MTLPRIPFEYGPSDKTDWNIDGIVAELRELRTRSLQARQRSGRPVKLPSRKVLTSIIEQLSTALFPNRLGSRELAPESVDYFVGHTLDTTLGVLSEEVLRELLFVAGPDDSIDEHQKKSIEITREFASRLPRIRALLETDIQAAMRSSRAIQASRRSRIIGWLMNSIRWEFRWSRGSWPRSLIRQPVSTFIPVPRSREVFSLITGPVS
jgi:hypothetical protein